MKVFIPQWVCNSPKASLDVQQSQIIVNVPLIRMNMLARIFHITYDRHYSSNNDSRDSEVLPNDRASRSGYTIRATIKPHTYA